MTAEQVHALLEYDPEAGEFRWKVDRAYAVKAGDRAGSLSSGGYISIRVAGRQYMAHRLAFLMMTGGWPPDQVDHINQVKTDNRWANLRPATHGQNVANRSNRRPKHNLPRGVKPAYGGRFESWISSDGRRRYIGSFNTVEQASEAYLAEARRVHGAFCPTQ